MNKRNNFIDILKGYAILLVVLGHCIQYGCGLLPNNLFFSNNIFKIIYSFHMPLFVLISGYLFYYSEKKRDLIHVIKDKFLGLIVPLIFFDIIMFILSLYTHRLVFSLDSFMSIILTRYWFFWTIFILSSVVSLINFLFKSKYNFIIFILIYIITFFIPDIWLFDLINYSYPFFIIGYLVNKYDILNKNFIKNHLNIYFVVLNITFIIMLLFFKDNYYVYVTNYYIFNGNGTRFMLFVDIYRFIIGLVGSITSILNIYFLIEFLKRIGYQDKVLTLLGKNSLGIYGVSCIVFEFIFITYSTFFNKFSYFYVCIETILVIWFCLFIIKLLSLNKITNKLFLGGK